MSKMSISGWVLLINKTHIKLPNLVTGNKKYFIP